MPKRSILSWYGGKYYMVNKLLTLIPKHKHYVEVYGGAANLLINKERAQIETYNDLNDGLVSLFRVVKDSEKLKKLIYLLTLTLYSRKEFEDASDWGGFTEEIIKASRFYVRYKMSRSGHGSSFANAKNTVRCGMSSSVSKWLSALPLLVDIHARFSTVQIENLPALQLITAYDDPNTFFYLDPPYVHKTRASRKMYKYEMSDQDHEDLINKLLTIKGKALLSGYDNQIYKKLEDNGWKVKVWEQRKHLNQGLIRKEKVWFNYEI